MNRDDLDADLRTLAALVILANVAEEREARGARMRPLALAADVVSDDELEPVHSEPGVRRNPRTGERFYSAAWLS